VGIEGEDGNSSDLTRGFCDNSSSQISVLEEFKGISYLMGIEEFEGNSSSIY
jgi:hypothetical protein